MQFHRIVLLLTLLPAAGGAAAAQFESFDDDEVHYVVVPTTFIEPDIAAQHGIVRGRDRALVNISVLRNGTTPSAAEVTGYATNLLGQKRDLDFREVREGDAVYYIAEFKHTDQDQLRFEVDIRLPHTPPYRLRFRHKVYAED